MKQKRAAVRPPSGFVLFTASDANHPSPSAACSREALEPGAERNGVRTVRTTERWGEMPEAELPEPTDAARVRTMEH
jgi:hypothetical protein